VAATGIARKLDPRNPADQKWIPVWLRLFDGVKQDWLRRGELAFTHRDPAVQNAVIVVQAQQAAQPIDVQAQHDALMFQRVMQLASAPPSGAPGSAPGAAPDTGSQAAPSQDPANPAAPAPPSLPQALANQTANIANAAASALTLNPGSDDTAKKVMIGLTVAGGVGIGAVLIANKVKKRRRSKAAGGRA
jgi:hypothetical protein